jgi:hypothetical protein
MDATKEFYNTYPTRESFLETFPILYKYITTGKSVGDQIVRMNIVVVNIRNILGWKTEGMTFASKIVDVDADPNIHEIARIKDANPILVLLLKCVTSLIWDVMSIALDDQPSEKLETYKNNVFTIAEP